MKKSIKLSIIVYINLCLLNLARYIEMTSIVYMSRNATRSSGPRSAYIAVVLFKSFSHNLPRHSLAKLP